MPGRGAESPCLQERWSNLDSEAYDPYDENQDCEAPFKQRALQAVVDISCKIQVIVCSPQGDYL